MWSVVVKGPFSPRGSSFAQWDYDRALAALRRLLPSTLTDDDPTPHRDIVFGMHASEISGRCSLFEGSAASLAVATRA